jgi:hypothetical protein
MDNCVLYDYETCKLCTYGDNSQAEPYCVLFEMEAKNITPDLCTGILPKEEVTE